MSAQGIAQIAVVMGSCTAGGAYVPAMSDEIDHRQEPGHHLPGRPAAGEGGHRRGGDGRRPGRRRRAHAAVGRGRPPGAERPACAGAGALASSPTSTGARTRTVTARASRARRSSTAEELYGVIPTDTRKPFDVREIIARIVDGSEFHEFKARYGATLVCGFAAHRGHAGGHRRQQRHPVLRDRRRRARTSSSCAASARSRWCSCRTSPASWSAASTRTKASRAHGAKMVTAVATANVPKFTIIIGGSFGAGNYGMCGRAYSPRFLWMWPNARISVMGGEQAASVLATVKRDGIEAKGGAVERGRRRGLQGADPRSSTRTQGHPYYATRAAVGRRRHRPGRHAPRAGAGPGGRAQRADPRAEVRHLPDVRQRRHAAVRTTSPASRRYHVWATHKLLATNLRALSDADWHRDCGLFFRSVHRTVNHLLVTDNIWYARFAEGHSPRMPLDTELHTERDALCEALRDGGARAGAPGSRRSTPSATTASWPTPATTARQVRIPFAPALGHVFNHATHHRGQLTAALTGMGQPGPELDWVYLLQQEAKRMSQLHHARTRDRRRRRAHLAQPARAAQRLRRRRHPRTGRCLLAGQRRAASARHRARRQRPGLLRRRQPQLDAPRGRLHARAEHGRCGRAGRDAAHHPREPEAGDRARAGRRLRRRHGPGRRLRHRGVGRHGLVLPERSQDRPDPRDHQPLCAARDGHARGAALLPDGRALHRGRGASHRLRARGGGGRCARCQGGRAREGASPARARRRCAPASS